MCTEYNVEFAVTFKETYTRKQIHPNSVYTGRAIISGVESSGYAISTRC